MPGITLPWSTPSFRIGGVAVGIIVIGKDLNMLIADADGMQGPYPTNLNPKSGALGNTSTCNVNGCLTIGGVAYDKMTGNLSAPGKGGGTLHVAGTGSIMKRDVAWSADDSIGIAQPGKPKGK